MDLSQLLLNAARSSLESGNEFTFSPMCVCPGRTCACTYVYVLDVCTHVRTCGRDAHVHVCPNLCTDYDTHVCVRVHVRPSLRRACIHMHARAGHTHTHAWAEHTHTCVGRTHAHVWAEHACADTECTHTHISTSWNLLNAIKGCFNRFKRFNHAIANHRRRSQQSLMIQSV